MPGSQRPQDNPKWGLCATGNRAECTPEALGALLTAPHPGLGGSVWKASRHGLHPTALVYSVCLRWGEEWTQSPCPSNVSPCPSQAPGPNMARRSQSSSQGDNPLAPGYLPPHYKEYYRLAVDALAEGGPEAYSRFLASEGAPAFLCPEELEHVSRHLRPPQHVAPAAPEGGPPNVDMDGSSGTYWPMNSDQAVPELDLGWPLTFGFQGTEVTTLVQPPPPDSPSIKDEARRMIRSAQQVCCHGLGGQWGKGSPSWALSRSVQVEEKCELPSFRGKGGARELAMPLQPPSACKGSLADEFWGHHGFGGCRLHSLACQRSCQRPGDQEGWAPLLVGFTVEKISSSFNSNSAEGFLPHQADGKQQRKPVKSWNQRPQVCSQRPQLPLHPGEHGAWAPSVGRGSGGSSCPAPCACLEGGLFQPSWVTRPPAPLIPHDRPFSPEPVPRRASLSGMGCRTICSVCGRPRGPVRATQVWLEDGGDSRGTRPLSHDLFRWWP